MTIKQIISVFRQMPTFCCALMLAACSNVERTVWEHTPSRIFHKNENYKLHELDPFKSGGALIVVDIMEVTHTDSRLWISLYSEQKTQIFINNIKIVLADGSLLEERTINTELVAANKKDKLFYSDLNALEFKTIKLEQAKTARKPITLKIFYTQDDKSLEMDFDFISRSERWTV